MERDLHIRVKVENGLYRLRQLCALIIAEGRLVMFPLNVQPDGRRTRIFSVVFQVREFENVLPLSCIDTVWGRSVEPVAGSVQDQLALGQKPGWPAGQQGNKKCGS